MQHVAGFEVPGVDGINTFVTAANIERDAANTNPTALRRVLDMDHNEVAQLSGEYLLRNLLVPNMPVGFYGDEEGEPVILAADIQVDAPGAADNLLKDARPKGNRLNVEIAPTLGRLLSVSCIRDPELGGPGIDAFSAAREHCAFSLFGGEIQVVIRYGQRAAES